MEHKRKQERKKEERELKERKERIRKAKEEHERARKEEEERRQAFSGKVVVQFSSKEYASFKPRVQNCM